MPDQNNVKHDTIPETFVDQNVHQTKIVNPELEGGAGPLDFLMTLLTLNTVTAAAPISVPPPLSPTTYNSLPFNFTNSISNYQNPLAFEQFQAQSALNQPLINQGDGKDGEDAENTEDSENGENGENNETTEMLNPNTSVNPFVPSEFMPTANGTVLSDGSETPPTVQDPTRPTDETVLTDEGGVLGLSQVPTIQNPIRPPTVFPPISTTQNPTRPTDGTVSNEEGGVLGLSQVSTIQNPTATVTPPISTIQNPTNPTPPTNANVSTEEGGVLGLSQVPTAQIPIKPFFLSSKEQEEFLGVSSLINKQIKNNIVPNLHFINYSPLFFNSDEYNYILQNPINVVYSIINHNENYVDNLQAHVSIKIALDLLNYYKNPISALNGLKQIDWTKAYNVELDKENMVYPFVKKELLPNQKKIVEAMLILFSKPEFNWKDFFLYNELSIHVCDLIYEQAYTLTLEEKNKWCEKMLDEVLKNQLGNVYDLIDKSIYEMYNDPELGFLLSSTLKVFNMFSAVGAGVATGAGAFTITAGPGALAFPVVPVSFFSGVTATAMSLAVQKFLFTPETYFFDKQLQSYKKAEKDIIKQIKDAINLKLKNDYMFSSNETKNIIDNTVQKYYNKSYIPMENVTGLLNQTFAPSGITYNELLLKHPNEIMGIRNDYGTIKLIEAGSLQKKIYAFYNYVLATNPEASITSEYIVKQIQSASVQFLGYNPNFLSNGNQSVTPSANNQLFSLFLGITQQCFDKGFTGLQNQTFCHQFVQRQCNQSFINNTFNFENFTNWTRWDNTPPFPFKQTQSFSEWILNWLDNIRKVFVYSVTGGALFSALYSQRSRIDWMRKFMISSLMYTSHTVLIIDKKDGKPKRARANVCLHWNLQTLEDRLRQYNHENPNVMNEYLHYFVLGEETNIIFFLLDQKKNVILKDFICNMLQFKKSVCFLLKSI